MNLCSFVIVLLAAFATSIDEKIALLGRGIPSYGLYPNSIQLPAQGRRNRIQCVSDWLKVEALLLS
jgi:hypothetical protein